MVTAMAQGQFLTQDLLHSWVQPKKKKKDVRLIGLMSLQLASDENSHQNNG